MKITIDNETKIMYISIFENEKIIDSEEIKPGVIYDFNQEDKVVGIEIFLDFNPELEPQLKKLLIA